MARVGVCTLPQDSCALYLQVRALVALIPTSQSASALERAARKRFSYSFPLRFYFLFLYYTIFGKRSQSVQKRLRRMTVCMDIHLIFREKQVIIDSILRMHSKNTSVQRVKRGAFDPWNKMFCSSSIRIPATARRNDGFTI